MPGDPSVLITFDANGTPTIINHKNTLLKNTNSLYTIKADKHMAL